MHDFNCHKYSCPKTWWNCRNGLKDWLKRLQYSPPSLLTHFTRMLSLPVVDLFHLEPQQHHYGCLMSRGVLKKLTFKRKNRVSHLTDKTAHQLWGWRVLVRRILSRVNNSYTTEFCILFKKKDPYFSFSAPRIGIHCLIVNHLFSFRLPFY